LKCESAALRPTSNLFHVWYDAESQSMKRRFGRPSSTLELAADTRADFYADFGLNASTNPGVIVDEEGLVVGVADHFVMSTNVSHGLSCRGLAEWLAPIYGDVSYRVDAQLNGRCLTTVRFWPDAGQLVLARLHLSDSRGRRVVATELIKRGQTLDLRYEADCIPEPVALEFEVEDASGASGKTVRHEVHPPPHFPSVQASVLRGEGDAFCGLWAFEERNYTKRMTFLRLAARAGSKWARDLLPSEE
jgi:hypothetical protein